MSDTPHGNCHNCGDDTDQRDTLNSHIPDRWECPYCKKARERAYDRYVDPTGFYQSRVGDPHG